MKHILKYAHPGILVALCRGFYASTLKGFKGLLIHLTHFNSRISNIYAAHLIQSDVKESDRLHFHAYSTLQQINLNLFIY